MRTCHKIFRTILTDVRVLGVRTVRSTVGWWRMALWSLVALAYRRESFCKALWRGIFRSLGGVYLHKSSEQYWGWR